MQCMYSTLYRRHIGIAAASITGTELVVNGTSVGTTSMTIKVSNGESQTIVVTVRNNAGSSGWM